MVQLEGLSGSAVSDRDGSGVQPSRCRQGYFSQPSIFGTIPGTAGLHLLVSGGSYQDQLSSSQEL